MRLMVDENCLRVTHRIFPETFNDRLMAAQVEFEGDATGEAPFQSDDFRGCLLAVFVDAALPSNFHTFVRQLHSHSPTAPARGRNSLLNIQTAINDSGKQLYVYLRLRVPSHRAERQIGEIVPKDHSGHEGMHGALPRL